MRRRDAWTPFLVFLQNNFLIGTFAGAKIVIFSAESEKAEIAGDRVQATFSDFHRRVTAAASVPGRNCREAPRGALARAF